MMRNGGSFNNNGGNFNNGGTFSNGTERRNFGRGGYGAGAEGGMFSMRNGDRNNQQSLRDDRPPMGAMRGGRPPMGMRGGYMRA